MPRYPGYEEFHRHRQIEAEKAKMDAKARKERLLAILAIAAVLVLLALLAAYGCSAPSPRIPAPPPESIPVPAEPPVEAPPPLPVPPTPPPPTPPVEAPPAPPPDLPPIPTATATADRIMLADFEDGKVSSRWQMEVANATNAGRYTWSVASPGANGSARALRFDVTHGAPYVYWLGNERMPGESGPAKHYMVPARVKVNRLAFWIKAPKGWGQTASRYFNLHIGVYLSNDPSKNETDNGHWYFMLFLVPDGEWHRVVLQANPAHQRSVGGQFDPGWSGHLARFPSFWSKMTRFYITGAPNPGDFAFFPGDRYFMWLDEVEFYHEDDVILIEPGIVRVPAGGVAVAMVKNLLPVAVTYSIKVTNLDGQAEAPATITIPAGGSKELRIAVKAKGASNVVLFPGDAAARADRFAQNRSDNTAYRGSYDEPGAGVLVVGE